jgi:uncharacterized membrane protein YeaQ/YmgE (transglycosylase-associated protein family)
MLNALSPWLLKQQLHSMRKCRCQNQRDDRCKVDLDLASSQTGRNHSLPNTKKKEAHQMGIIWTIIIGFIAGVLAKLIMPGSNEPSGFILTTILGIVGAFVASFLGQALGWYGAGEGAGLIGAVVGAIIVLAVWGMVAKRA